jgi:hypothetical protein
MSITVNGYDGNPCGQNSFEAFQMRFIKAHYRLALSGTPASGGDTLDFTNGGVNSAVPPLGRVIESISIRGHGSAIGSFVGSGGYYALIGTPGVTANTAWKLNAYSAGGTSQGGTAYASFTGGSALTDTIELEVVWAP